MANRKHQEIVEKIKALIKKKYPAKKAKLLMDFAQHYYALVSAEDLSERSPEDLYAIMYSHWNFIYKRMPGECKVRVFNPDEEDHGWQTTHTVVEVGHDDMPFLVDSVRMEINRQGYLVHYVVHLGGIRLRRNAKGEIIEILPREQRDADSMMDAPILVIIDRQTEQKAIDNLCEGLVRVLADVSMAVSDWEPMLDRLDQSLNELEQSPPKLDPAEVAESKAFLRWMKENFILFGCRDHAIKTVKKEKVFQAIPNTGFGVLSEACTKHVRYLSEMPAEARKLTLSAQVLIIAKTNTQSTIHRSGYTDYIGVKMFDKKGNIIGERRFIGLYTSAAYNTSPKNIPFLRLKVAKVLQQTGFMPTSHAGKNVLNILETLPRDDLFQASVDELHELALGIFHLQERQRIRLFARKDPYGRFYSCLVYIPRDSFNTDLLQEMRDILQEFFQAEEISYSIWFSESILARIHFIVRVNPDKPVDVDLKAVEQKLIEVGLSWRQELVAALVEYFGEAEGLSYFTKYKNAFLASYREAYTVRTAVHDIEHIEALADEKPLNMNFYQPINRADKIFHFKVYQRSFSIPLSDALPILENMGFRVLGESPHKVALKADKSVWINDFEMTLTRDRELDIQKVKDSFQRAFAAIWLGKAENDNFNHLVISANLTWREVVMLRAYAKYFQQIGFTFSQAYIAQTLVNNSEIAKMLVDLFKLRFNPAKRRLANKIEALEIQITEALEAVSNLDEDRILRRYLDVMKATLRTNYYQKQEIGGTKSYLSFKFKPDLIPDLPLPVPMYEIFVYSPRFEGVHLRGAKVARGGLRWSDRREDFRTEVLGLMKAQQVKNAVIVPLGAKGGFVAKHLPIDGSREAIQQEGIACYQLFIRGLLDVTDNIVNQAILPPTNVVRYDEDDPYLVVAADKGTATFSDIANAISLEYNFWLGDAFASGGSAGYDHKKMGITARGAWESVKRHFREMDIDIQNTPFTVVGVGDMAGDVFGNGMLQSKCIKLVAAFNHLHIFIDPNPDPDVSFKERQRLFNLPRSSWEDYNEKLISEGGGIFKRSAKSIRLSPEIKKLLGVKRDSMTPNEVINAILCAQVDLLWNGGIGTYIKASTESHASVGDRANDVLRVNANQLNCKVIGEGGNLGVTQLGRIEYSLLGGKCYTDFIDNSAGVDCSDHEVNIKILLNLPMQRNELNEKQRNKLLAAMTDEVGDLVLFDNYSQTQAVSMAAEHSATSMELYARYIEEFVNSGRLNRELEFLPDEKNIAERKMASKGLTRPEMAVLFAYGKTRIKEQLLASTLLDEPYFINMLAKEFPQPLIKKYSKDMLEHSLRREITATQVVNHLVNQMGITFIERVQEETNASTDQIVRAYFAAEEIFNKIETWQQIEKLDNKVPAQTQYFMMKKINRLMRRATRWLLRHYPENMNIAHFKKSVAILRSKLPQVVGEANREKIQAMVTELTEQNVPKALAETIALSSMLLSSLDIIEAADATRTSIDKVASAYFMLGENLAISWVREQIISYEVEDRWDALARSATRSDLDYIQRHLLIGVLSQKTKEILTKFERWAEKYSYYLTRWDKRIAEIRTSDDVNLTMFSVAIRDLMDLVQVMQ